MALLPRPGFPLDGTIRVLNELEAASTGISNNDLWARWQRYLNWAHDVEMFFRQYFTGFRLERLYTERFWQGQSLAGSSPYAPGLLNNELELQVAFLRGLKDALTREERRQADMKGIPVAVPDTNVLLHCSFFTDVKWDELLGTERVRLAVPLRVIDELDRQKALGRDRVAERAGAVIKQLQQRTVSLTDAPVPLRSGVTLEVVRVPQLDADLYVPPLWADVEILDTCETLAIFAASPVTLVTRDFGMQLRASTREIRTLVMPDERLVPSQSNSSLPSE